MKNSFVILASICLASIQASASGIEGSIVYQTARPGAGYVPIYGLDAEHPTLSVAGDDLSLYSNRLPLLGDKYVAELWIGSASATESQLSPVRNSKAAFRTAVNAIYGNNNFHIPGSLGGDKITVQLRVWARHDGNRLLNSWDDVLRDPNAARGKSDLGHMILGNVSADGHPYVPQYLGNAIQGFGLSIVPEPSVTLLGAASFGALLLLRRGSRR